ncbi:MAG: ribbon-helix-helix protein, CopG family [Deltaproteobacteria bacterium]|nr:ribbon-helix-helix protein, CopG family [Deltaproteobacteria bacterium]
MVNLSIKLPESLLERLDSVADKKGESRSVLLREAIEMIVNTDNKSCNDSCLELARDLAGSVNGPDDLSCNKDRLEGYGK